MLSTIIFTALQMRKLRHRRGKDVPKVHIWEVAEAGLVPRELHAKFVLSPTLPYRLLKRASFCLWVSAVVSAQKEGEGNWRGHRRGQQEKDGRTVGLSLDIHS